MSPFQQIVAWGMAHSNTLLFALLWLTITAAATIWVTFVVCQAPIPMSQKATRRPISPMLMWRQTEAPQSVLALMLLAVFLAAYISMILVWEDFAYYDDSFFNLFTLKGHNLQLEIWPESGRFCPLGLQEFNLIRHFAHTITGYHLIPIAQLLTFSWILIILDDELTTAVRVALVILALLAPSIFVSFGGLNFQERDVLFFLACVVLSVKRFEQTNSIGWALAAVISAQLMIYCKETACLLILGFAISRLILRYWKVHLAGLDYDRLWDRESRLDLCLAVLAVLYVILYLRFVGIHPNMNYAAAARLPLADVVLGYTKLDLLPWLLVAVLLCRMYLLLLYRGAPLLFWDALAVGGVACLFGYVYLGLFSGYYLAPVDLIAILYVGRFTVLAWGQIRFASKLVAMLLVCVVLFQNVLVSAFSLYERKNVIHAKAEIASVVKAEYQRGVQNDLRLFFPFAGGYVIMEFGGYLSYRGVPVEGAGNDASGPNSVVLAEASSTRAKLGGRAEDGPCVTWTTIWCQLVSGPAPGDLVVVLPDDEASRAEASMYREPSKLLFTYEPLPSVPHWLFWLFDRLPIGAQTRYRYGALPDRWMNASVTIWK